MGKTDMLKLTGIKTKSSIFISDMPDNNWSSSVTYLNHYYFDGKKPKQSFHKHWVEIKSMPKKIQKDESQPDINHRYELIDKSMVNKTIKKVLEREDVAYYSKSECYWIWKKEYRHLQSLYELKYDKQASVKVDIEFELDIILELDEIKQHGLLSFTVQKTQYTSDGTIDITNQAVSHQFIDKIVYPAIILPSRPCSLTSLETYKIIREHVKNNIDPKIAQITSDYDFCFTVQKKIEFAEPEKYTVDVNNGIFQKRKRKPKYETRFRTERLVVIFEMTHEEKGYQNYTPIKGFRGTDHTDLKEKIDFYLESLMEFINKPVKDCPKCKGCGVIVDKKFNVKKKTTKVKQ